MLQLFHRPFERRGSREFETDLTRCRRRTTPRVEVQPGLAVAGSILEISLIFREMTRSRSIYRASAECGSDDSVSTSVPRRGISRIRVGDDPHHAAA
jgi:hypothetical protein